MVSSKIVSLFKINSQTALQYPVETLVRMFDNFFLSFVVLLVWRTIFTLNKAPAEALDQIIVFYLCMPVVVTLTSAWQGYFFARSIRQGDLNSLLIKPYRIMVSSVANNLTEKLFKLVFLGPMIIGAYYYFRPRFNTTIQGVVYMTAAVILASVLYFIIQEIVGYLGFWFEEVSSLNDLLSVLDITVGGRAMPIYLFPGWLFSFASVLPFRYLNAFPVEVMMGTVNRDQVLFGFGIMLGWIMVLGLLARLLWFKGLQRYGAYGG